MPPGSSPAPARRRVDSDGGRWRGHRRGRRGPRARAGGGPGTAGRCRGAGETQAFPRTSARGAPGEDPHSAHASDNTAIDSAGEPRLHFAA